jgi:twitching motility protein PilJ
VTTPLKRLEQAAKSYAEGDLSERAEIESRDEFGTLADVFNQMAEGVAQRQAELLAAKAEVEEQNDALQEEVEHLLDIVSEIEDGNLTVQARVSTQATGLIADTLNRLSEQLGIILATVLSTSRDVTFNAEGLEKLAVAVAENAQQQVQSVVQASQNLESITKLALVASEQASEADLAVGSAQEAVGSGRQEVVNLTGGIEQLQRGTEQMVARVKSLGEFLDLAKQFVQDQKRLASLTQVLAMNASMVAARAVEQREPDQFASVAREFEAIAAQVNNLASRTSEGLLLLQQRTGFIEIVVSGIRQDIEGLTGLVSNFSQSVEQSNDAFENIRLVTERVARVGSAVTESSREIANAIRQSFASVREIEAIAERSAEQAKFTRERSAEMGAMSRQLLQEVEYFRLPPEKLAAVGIDVVATRVEEDLAVLR